MPAKRLGKVTIRDGKIVVSPQAMAALRTELARLKLGSLDLPNIREDRNPADGKPPRNDPHHG